jgi:hypothetical protein
MGTTASIKQKKDSFNATTGLEWTLTLLPTPKSLPQMSNSPY